MKKRIMLQLGLTAINVEPEHVIVRLQNKKYGENIVTLLTTTGVELASCDFSDHIVAKEKYDDLISEIYVFNVKQQEAA
jgi:hypothetical protein